MKQKIKGMMYWMLELFNPSNFFNYLKILNYDKYLNCILVGFCKTFSNKIHNFSVLILKRKNNFQQNDILTSDTKCQYDKRKVFTGAKNPN